MNSSKNSFYVVLFSNNNTDFYPNSLSQFTNNLTTPLDLENNSWSVALSEFYYNEFVPLEAIVAVEDTIKEIEEKELQEKRKKEESQKIKKKGPLTPLEVAEEIEARKKKTKPDTTTVTFENTTCIKNTINGELSCNSLKIKTGGLVFLYLDIIEARHIGSSKSQVLKVMHINGTPSATLRLQNLEFVPVRYSHISSISVRITDSTNTNLNFVRSNIPTVLVLKFEKNV